MFSASCRMNEVEVEVKGRWFTRRFEEVDSPPSDYLASCVIIGTSKDGSKSIDYVNAKGKLRLGMTTVYTRIEFQPVVSWITGCFYAIVIESIALLDFDKIFNLLGQSSHVFKTAVFIKYLPGRQKLLSRLLIIFLQQSSNPLSGFGSRRRYFVLIG
jgi:hypothetical protein